MQTIFIMSGRKSVISSRIFSNNIKLKWKRDMELIDSMVHNANPNLGDNHKFFIDIYIKIPQSVYEIADVN